MNILIKKLTTRKMADIENPIENLFVLIALTLIVAKLLLCVVHWLIPNEHMIGDLQVVVIVALMLWYIEEPIMKMKYERLMNQPCIYYGLLNHTKCEELNMYGLDNTVHNFIV